MQIKGQKTLLFVTFVTFMDIFPIKLNLSRDWKTETKHSKETVTPKINRKDE